MGIGSRTSYLGRAALKDALARELPRARGEVKRICVTIPAFDNSYLRLPERFYARVDPMRPPAPGLIAINRDLACELGFDSDWVGQPGGFGHPDRASDCRGLRANCHRLCRAPIRKLCAAAWGRARDPARRGR